MGADSPSARLAVAAALELLGRRGYSVRALKARLRGKGFAASAIDLACARCAELGYLDDRCFGLSRAEVRLQRQPRGSRSIQADLRRQGVDSTMCEEIADQVLAQAGGERAVLNRALQTWLARYGEPTDWQEAKRCYDHLLRRGFRAAMARNALSEWLDALGD